MKTPAFNSFTYVEHAAEIIGRAVLLLDAGQSFALITSLAIEGGAAREVGSLALVEETGAMTGYLSNGCIDRDIQHHALQALRMQRKKLIRYGDGSRYADLKLPCGGALTVLIDPAPDAKALRRAAEGFAARQPVTLDFHDDHPAQGTGMMGRFCYAPRFRLTLAGRGAIFRAMAQIGHATGFEIHLLSPDVEDLAAMETLASQEPLHLTTPDAAPELEMLDDYGAFLTLFHDHDWEPALLRAALKTPARFIGSLGSRRTHEMRKQTLIEMGVRNEALLRLNGPIGLVPSLRDAPSIAVSTLAQIVAAFPTAIEAKSTQSAEVDA